MVDMEAALSCRDESITSLTFDFSVAFKIAGVVQNYGNIIIE